MGKNKTIGWWSAGITSAVACKMALEMYDNVELYYLHIDTAHQDNVRFKRQCENWYGVEIKELKSSKYADQFEVIEGTGYVNGAGGARCTLELKKEVRFKFERENPDIEHQVWGYEFDRKQINRAIRFGQQYPYTNPLFPLIEKGLDKDVCAGLILNQGIELPEMYKLGYPNNNCIGCVKGGKGYWNKIRVDFPETFERMAKAERVAGHSCIKGTFLDELEQNAGRDTKIVMPNCGLLCEVEFADIPDKNLEDVIKGSMTIYDAIKRIADDRKQREALAEKF